MDPAVTSALRELLSSEQRPGARTLAGISDLRPRQLEGFLSIWLEAPAKRRRVVATTLAALTEDSFDLFFDEIFKLLLEDPDPQVRRTAIEALCECDDIAVADRLLHLLAADADEAVRAQAAIALGHFAYLAEMEELAPQDAERIRAGLLRMATDQAAPLDVRRRAIEALGFLSGDAEIHAIIAAAHDAPQVKMRASALYAMGRNCDERWSPLVLPALESAEPELRFEAARAAGELEERRAVPALLGLLDDEDFEVRLEAIAALGKIGGDRAKAALRRLAEHRDERITGAAADALDEALFADDLLHP